MVRRSGLAGVLCAMALAVATAQSPKSGLDLANFDQSVRPQDDLYRFVNGGWLDRTAVPPERVSYTVFTELTDRAELELRAIIESIAATGNRKNGSTTQQIADLYSSLMDQDRIERIGAAPLEPELDRIAAIKNPRELAAEAGYLTSIAGGGPFEGTVSVDSADSSRIVVRVAQGGTLLPDRDYYVSSDLKLVTIREKYVEYLAHIFRLAGRPNAEGSARDVLALETELAKAQWTPAESRDPARTFNPQTLEQMAAAMPGFDWYAWARPQGIDRAAAVSLTQPSFFRRFAALVPALPLETWKAWLTGRYLTASAPWVNWAFNGARFEFFGTVLTGQEAPRLLWKRSVGLVSTYLGDAVGKLYVERRFSPAARNRAQALVNNLLAAYKHAINTSDWMSPAARRAALDKLSRISTKVGYPDRWRDYRGLEIRPDDLLGNVQRAQKFQNDYRINKVQRPEDRGEWLMTPQTVNAYYNPVLNEIVLPAAMLQPPLFDADADDAVNYGSIGGVIGHELAHAFDSQGRMFDAAGAMHNWWTADDEQAYLAQARVLVNQYDGYSPLAGMHVNGTLTLGENAGDLAGLAMAFQAYKISLGGKPSPVIDGFTGEQRFFLGWAQTWRTVMHEPYLRQWLLATPYAPPQYRANGPIQHIQAFYDTFGLKEGDGLYRDKDKRIVMWK